MNSSVVPPGGAARARQAADRTMTSIAEDNPALTVKRLESPHPPAGRIAGRWRRIRPRRPGVGGAECEQMKVGVAPTGFPGRRQADRPRVEIEQEVNME